MQVVFDIPMTTHRFHHCFGRHAFGQGDVIGECLGLSLRGAPFAFDPAERDETGERRRAFGRRDNAGAAAMETVVSFFAPFMKGKRAGRIGLREGLKRASKQRPVVGLELEGVVGARGANAFGHFGMAMQGVRGDDAALQIKAFQHFQGRRDLVAVGAGARGDRHPRL